MRRGNNYSGARWAFSQRPRRPRGDHRVMTGLTFKVPPGGEFTCSRCNLTRTRTQLAGERDGKPICRDCEQEENERKGSK